jgi:hypothetical protein
MKQVLVRAHTISSAELATKARLNAAMSVGMGLIMLLFLILAAIYAPTLEAFSLIGGLLVASVIVYLLNYFGYIRGAGWVFLLSFSSLVVGSMLLNPSVNSHVPYFLGVVVVLSGSLIGPVAPVVVATIGTLLTILMVRLAAVPVVAQGSIPVWLEPVLLPGTLLYLLAIVSWLYSAETNRMLSHLRGMAHAIQDSMHVLSASAGEILSTTAQVAAGATETAAAISETTTTVEEVRQTALITSQKAKAVADSAQRSVQVSQSGLRAVDETIQCMQAIQAQMESIASSIVRLSEQSQAIGVIIAAVTDLADQSNLLAVNAAIEAAKAGEQGRGFTVVAQEIKHLADQSKQATTQVRAILSDIQKATSSAVMASEQGSKAVEAGAKQSAETNASIRRLSENITEAAQAAIQIAASSQQQLVGMDQVREAMEHITLAGTQNATSTKQVEVTAQNLHELGQKLKQMVDQFQI